MIIDNILNFYRERFPQHGSFEWRPGGESLRTLTNKSGVPHSYGVYLLFGRRAESRELLHVEKVGMMRSNGNLKGLRLDQRINGTQDRRPMEDFLEREMAFLWYEAMVIEWFVTVGDHMLVLPAKAQADLLQAHFDEQGKLPRYNEQI